MKKIRDVFFKFLGGDFLSLRMNFFLTAHCLIVKENYFTFLLDFVCVLDTPQILWISNLFHSMLVFEIMELPSLQPVSVVPCVFCFDFMSSSRI